jgi:hypothetical protein
MRTIIAGSRHLTGEATGDLCLAIAECGFGEKITSVVCGGAKGIDNLGDLWAKVMGLPVSYYLIATEGRIDFSHYRNLVPPYEDGGATYRNVVVASDWALDGRFAGPKRNMTMADNADALILVPLKGDRRGSDSMKRCAERRGLLIYEWEVTE